MPYATPAQYTEWAGAGATVTEAALGRASGVIDDLTAGVVYDLEHGPTAAALRDATCAQAAWFDDTGDITGASAVLGSAGIGTVKLGAAGAGSQAEAGQRRYAPEAIGILRTNGLLRKTIEYC